MPGWIRQNTARTLKLPPAVDSSTPDTSEIGLTITRAQIRLSKEGGDLAQKNEASDCTHDEIGVYDCPVDATDTNTVGTLDIYYKSAGVLHLWDTYQVFPEHVYDAFHGSDDISYAEGAVWLDSNSGASSNSGTARKPMDSIANAITKLTSTGLSRLAIVNDQTVTLTASMLRKEIFGFGRRGIVNFNGQDISECTIRNLLVYGDTLAASGLPEFVDCVVGTGIYASLHARRCRLNGVIGVSGSAAYLTDCIDEGGYSAPPDLDFGSPGSTLRVVMHNYVGRLDVLNMNNNASLLLSGIGELTIDSTCLAGNIVLIGSWEVTDNASGAITPTNTKLQADLTDVTGSMATATALANAQTSIDGIKDVTDKHPDSGQFSTIDSNLTDALADTNEMQSDLADGGRIDLLIDDIVTRVTSVQAVTQEIPDSGKLTTLQSGVTAIEVDTQNIQSRLPAALVSGRMDVSVGAMAADVMTAAAASSDFGAELQALITGGAYALDTDANGRVRVVDGTDAGELDTDDGRVIVNSFSTTARAAINAEMVDVMDTDALTLPGQVAPPATPTRSEVLGYLYKAWRNKKTQSSSALSLFADDGTTVDQTAPVSDNGSLTTVGEMAVGS